MFFLPDQTPEIVLKIEYLHSYISVHDSCYFSINIPVIYSEYDLF
jgi:hypothetical protein